MKDEKCREAWDRFEEEPFFTDEQRAFAGKIAERTSQPENYHRAAGFHAGYHARKVPSVDEIENLEEMHQLVHPDDISILSKAIHRLMVEGGE